MFVTCSRPVRLEFHDVDGSLRTVRLQTDGTALKCPLRGRCASPAIESNRQLTGKTITIRNSLGNACFLYAAAAR